MVYQLKNGEEIRNGKLWGWTGASCHSCKGTGQKYSETFDNEISCTACAGTGEEWGLMPVQPNDLPIPTSPEKTRRRPS
jgi:hypothetical protein